MRKGDMRMKIDMHCHVKEGSIDSKIGLEEYITYEYAKTVN